MSVLLSLVDVFKIHHCIHDGDDEVTLSNGEKIELTMGKNKCRECVIAGWRFMEQNRTKPTAYATRSRKGERLTWVIPPSRAKWGLLANDKVEIRCSIFGEDDGGTNVPAAKSVINKRPLAASEEKKSVLMKKTKKERDEDDAEDEEEKETDEKKKLRLETRTYTLAVDFPKYWSTPLNKHQRIALRAGDDDWKKIDLMLNSTIAPSHASRFGYSKLTITKLERLQNPDLWNHYFLRKKEVKYQNDDKPAKLGGVQTELVDGTANEFYFFHGLNIGLVDKIANHGFDERVSNLAGMFGCGIYFAENSSKSVLYAHTSTCQQSGAVYLGQNSVCTCTGVNDVERVMFLCRVCIGTPHIRLEATDKEKPLRRPPDREDTGIPFDSVLGESAQWDAKAKLAFREFIVYDRRQCYPEYIIGFKCRK